MRTHLPHLAGTWLYPASTVLLFADACARRLVPEWAPVSNWAGWAFPAVMLFCYFRFAKRHDRRACPRCPASQLDGIAAARRYRWFLHAFHSPGYLGLVVVRLGGGIKIFAALIFIVLLIVPFFLVGWFAPQGFALPFLCAYLSVLYLAIEQHQKLALWCAWCGHKGWGGGGGGPDDGPRHPTPGPGPTSKRTLTLAA